MKLSGLKTLLILSMALVCHVSWGQGCSELPAEKTISDQKGGCLALVPIGTPLVTAKTLVVLLHGDGEGQLGQRQIDRWTAIGRSLSAPDRNVVFMIRPGYQSPAGNSSGWANPKDDDYTAANMARVAGALGALKTAYKSEKLVLVGHSGGAATSALVLGKHPGVADAALLLGCPCDVPPWRDHRNAQRRDLDQAAVRLHARLFGRVPAHQSVDPPAVRGLRRDASCTTSRKVEALS